MRLSQRPGARWDQQVSPSLLEGERVGLRERERVSIVLHWQSRSQLEQRERRWSLEKQNDTCLSKEGAQRLAEGEKKHTLVLGELN